MLHLKNLFCNISICCEVICELRLYQIRRLTLACDGSSLTGITPTDIIVALRDLGTLQ